MFQESQVNNHFQIKNDRYRLKANINYDDFNKSTFYVTVEIHDIQQDEDIGVFYLNIEGKFWYLDIYDDPLSQEEEQKITHKAIEILKLFFDVKKYENSPASVKELTSIPPNANPFVYDRERSGVEIIPGYVAMFMTPMEGQDLETFILVNTRTGRRIEIDLKPI